ncbi:uncharacterized protein [Rutidosis leptorrhynchoides]|uniref:uncharacterized protein n=1 Tax=Rutidosis leptorrhynchoides TaxID=125765 RepID=UPI003A99BCE4
MNHSIRKQHKSFIFFPIFFYFFIFLFFTKMTTSISSPIAYSRVPSNSQINKTSKSSSCSVICLKSSKNYGERLVGVFSEKNLVRSKHGFRCNSSSSPGDPAPENESKQVLDAFFLGKAFAEALNERIESTVGEFLSTVGRLQAEQQKQVLEFQDEVLERAKKAKEKAAREALEAQGRVPNYAATNTINVSAAVDEPKVGSSLTSSGSEDESTNNGSTDPPLEISIDD